MAEDRLQSQRRELKYLLDEETAGRVREFVRCHLQLDPFGEDKPDFAYPVHSLYLDPSALSSYWHTINGNKNRFKLRLRYYNDSPKSPVFFEIKQRVNDIILKSRAAVRREAVRHVLAGQVPALGELLRGNPRDLVAIQRFVELLTLQGAEPRLHIFYTREAYEDPGNNAVRVTFDRVVSSAPYVLPNPTIHSHDPRPVFGRQVILELKFTNRYPDWFQDLVEHFDCMQAGAAKYAEGIFQKGEDWATRTTAPARASELLDQFLRLSTASPLRV